MILFIMKFMLIYPQLVPVHELAVITKKKTERKLVWKKIYKIAFQCRDEKNDMQKKSQETGLGQRIIYNYMHRDF